MFESYKPIIEKENPFPLSLTIAERMKFTFNRIRLQKEN
jgi:hypothetical protein